MPTVEEEQIKIVKKSKHSRKVKNDQCVRMKAAQRESICRTIMMVP
jgi:hypothetical protein